METSSQDIKFLSAAPLYTLIDNDNGLGAQLPSSSTQLFDRNTTAGIYNLLSAYSMCRLYRLGSLRKPIHHQHVHDC
jgi:hypothetical protein